MMVFVYIDGYQETLTKSLTSSLDNYLFMYTFQCVDSSLHPIFFPYHKELKKNVLFARGHAEDTAGSGMYLSARSLQSMHIAKKTACHHQISQVW